MNSSSSRHNLNYVSWEILRSLLWLSKMLILRVLEPARSSSQVRESVVIIVLVEHTDPGMDFFEVGYRAKYKKKYAHFLNQRIIFEEPNIATDPNSSLFEDPSLPKRPLARKKVFTK